MTSRYTATTRPYTEEAHAIAARDVEFDWRDVPLHYIPGEPFASHFWNVMHLIVPLGEQMMAGCVAEALPYISDERLREEAVGFIGQESMHANSHGGYHERLAEQGIDIEPIVRHIEHMLRVVFGDHGLTGRAKREWLHERVAFYAGLEHYTAIIGQWFLDADALEAAGMHPVMLDLLRWHGAEEVEHRNVLFDIFQHLDGGYFRRTRTVVAGSVGLLATTFTVVDLLYRQDPEYRWWKPWPVEAARAIRRGLIPSPGFFLTELPPYLRPGFHPSSMGSLDKALHYLAISPAARAAQH
ncbi:metal-dependent hydrolase [Nocardia terpenica]|uniref:Metal-dependent hydrolase n=1 Tax=Nocardia terpenica TaxID=455432 RepID=A0A6G9Z3D5_9NOCA|nr:metal-dependent hydrolase [Nocardia terpenica]QIS20038.1 metal-dependent hydrolase [Nocardia terpenica]